MGGGGGGIVSKSLWSVDVYCGWLTIENRVPRELSETYHTQTTRVSVNVNDA